ncbi:hypothetical protein BVC80_209g331 [Macleaya cordata]|uniref:Uncharacterized protein n=1 Tax=Macleaya cordata TaxID=56857 RepID=A0A200QDV4_MACCD|nr:hypothetical protein BVC80_209g331 [Macleaya cordata]
MGSSYFGEPSLGNGRSGSSKKGKKSNSDKPKQPQRGLGVAQLEKIRLHHQMGCSYIPSLHTSPAYHANLSQEDVRVETTYSSVPSSSSSFSYSSSQSYGYHPNIMMGLREMEGTDIRYGDSQSCTTARWNHNNGILDTQYATQPSMTRQLLSLQMEDSVQKKKIRKDRCNSMGSSSQNSGDSSEMQELDLDLKLSL